MQIVSFDIFDTLIKRDVLKPEDVFFLMEKYCRKNNIPVPEDFAQCRIKADKTANRKCGGTATVDDIYSELRELTGSDLTGIMDLEIDFEVRLCRPNEEMVSLFHKYIDRGITVVLISDMYLPECVIQKMLSKCGIEGYKKIYISAYCGHTKRSGELFDYVISDLGITKKQLLHIGDNKKSDFIVPLRHGIKARLIRSTVPVYEDKLHILSDSENWEYQILSLFLDRIKRELNYDQQMGCMTMGPLLFGFSQWLRTSLKKSEIHDVFFFSRDGYIMKKAFDMINDDPSVNSSYFYCSRRSFLFPLLWKCNSYKDVFSYLALTPNTKVRLLLLKMGFDPKQYSKLAEEYGIDMGKTYRNHTIENDETVAGFVERILQDIREQSIEEFNAIKKYLETMSAYAKIAVVDIGVRGTIQTCMEALLREISVDTDITGYYLGISEDSTLVRKAHIKVNGFLFDQEHGRDIEQLLDSFQPVLEVSFFAPHGSVRRFRITEKDLPEPVFEEYEYIPDRMHNEESFLMDLHNGAMVFIDEMNNSLLSECLDFSPRVSFSFFARMGNIPTLKETISWENVRFYDYNIYHIAKATIEGFPWFPESVWRIGCMKRFFRLPLRYDKLLPEYDKRLRKLDDLLIRYKKLTGRI